MHRIGFAWLVALLVLAVSAPLRAEEARITVKKFRVSGNTLLTPDEVRRTLDPYAGKALTLAELKAAARKLRGVYRARGYVMAHAYVPPQDFNDDTVEIRVQEGRYGKVRAEGNRHYTDTFIARFFNPARRSGLLQQEPLQRALLVLNQNLDLRVQSVLEARKDGTVDVTLKVKDDSPVHYIVDYDNFGVRLVGRNRAGAGVIAGNALFEGDVLALKVTHPFNVEKADPFYFFNYGAPVGDRGNRLEATYAKANTFVGQELAALGIEGAANIYTLRGTVLDEVTLDANTAWYAEVAIKDIKNTALDRALLVSNDQVRELNLGHRGTHYTSGGKVQVAHVLQGILGLGKALGGSEATDTTSRRGADNEFARGTAEVVAIRRLNSKGFLLGRLTAQVASDSLMVPEQFALGGPDSVRGYQQGEALGDDGIAVTGEYRHTMYQSQLSSVQALAFFDHGTAYLKNPVGTEARNTELTGTGLGMRGQFGRSVSARADVGLALSPGRNLDGDKTKLHAQVNCRF